MRFYGVTKFRVFSVLDDKGIYPIETKIEYDFNNSRKVNHVRLQRFLQRNIKNVNNFFFVVQDNKIIIHLDYTRKSHVEFDFEFSSN
jgi:serine/threonine-protein kinase RIO1